jgi:hypothetical protein
VRLVLAPRLLLHAHARLRHTPGQGNRQRDPSCINVPCQSASQSERGLLFESRCSHPGLQCHADVPGLDLDRSAERCEQLRKEAGTDRPRPPLDGPGQAVDAQQQQRRRRSSSSSGSAPAQHHGGTSAGSEPDAPSAPAQIRAVYGVGSCASLDGAMSVWQQLVLSRCLELEAALSLVRIDALAQAVEQLVARGHDLPRLERDQHRAINPAHHQQLLLG